MKVSPENFIKVTLMAVIGMAVLRMVADRFNVPGLDQVLRG